MIVYLLFILVVSLISDMIGFIFMFINFSFLCYTEYHNN